MIFLWLNDVVLYAHRSLKMPSESQTRPLLLIRKSVTNQAISLSIGLHTFFSFSVALQPQTEVKYVVPYTQCPKHKPKATHMFEQFFVLLMMKLNERIKVKTRHLN